MSMLACGRNSRSRSAYPSLGASPPAAFSRARPSAVFPSITSRRGAGIENPSGRLRGGRCRPFFYIGICGHFARVQLGGRLPPSHAAAREGTRTMADFDLAIIGGGINGAGIARDAAGRSLRVLLVEQGDLASGTSSASTKLIHGGLRYLEHGAFLLVRESLKEREVLLRNAPHIIRPLRFLLPPQPQMRSPLLLRLGLFIYDHIGGRKILPPTRTVDLTHNVLGTPLKRSYKFGFLYSDCWVDDARLVVLNALDAAERGADIRTRTKCVRAERGEEWRLILNARGRREVVTARALVNAS